MAFSFFFSLMEGNKLSLNYLSKDSGLTKSTQFQYNKYHLHDKWCAGHSKTKEKQRKSLSTYLWLLLALQSDTSIN